MPGLFAVVVIIVVDPWTAWAWALMSMVTGGMGGGGDAAIVASHVPLLSNGKLPYSDSDVVIVIVPPSPQILLPGRGNC